MGRGGGGGSWMFCQKGRGVWGAGGERHIFFGLKLPCLLRWVLRSTANAAKKDMPSPA